MKELPARKLPSWITGYLDYTTNAPAPYIFRRWAAISAVGAAMTRRAWIHNDHGILYPNQITLLCGASGTGKGPAINPIYKFFSLLDVSDNPLTRFDNARIGPGNATPAGLFDELLDEKSQKNYKLEGKTHTFSSIVLIVEEASTLFHDIDKQMMSILIRFFNGDEHSQRLRSKGERMTIEKPLIHVLGGLQPKLLNSIFPENAWGMGLTARATFIYSNEHIIRSPFRSVQNDINLEKPLIHDLERIMKLKGEFKLRDDAVNFLEDWWLHKSQKDRQRHPKMEAGYNQKRIMQVLRLCAIHSAAVSDDMIVTLENAKNALADMLEAESLVPVMFNEMHGVSSQVNVIEEVMLLVNEEFARTQKSIPYHTIARILARRVAPYEVPQIIQLLVDQSLLREIKKVSRVPGAAAAKAYAPTKEVKTAFNNNEPIH